MTVKAHASERTVSLTDDECEIIRRATVKERQRLHRDLRTISAWDRIRRQHGMENDNWDGPEHRARSLICRDLDAVDRLEAKIK